MKALMISSDRKILDPGSAVAERMKEYGGLVNELNIVLLSDASHSLKKTQLAPNVWVYPTNSINRFLRPLDAFKIGKNISCDFITTQDPFECGWAGLRLKKAKNVRLEVQLHTDPFSKNFNGFLNVIRKMIAGDVLMQADRIRVVLRSVGDKIIEKYDIQKEKISALPIYVDRKRISGEAVFNLHERYGFKTVVLSVSRLSKEKDIGVAIRALKDISDAGLVIVGIGPEENSLRSLAQKLNIKSRVVFEGWQENLSSYYKTADIFIQTSNFEGYGLSLVEAGLSSLPVITTPVGVANDLENVVIAESVETFAKSLKELSANREEAKKLGEELRKELEAEILTKESYLTKLKENWTRLC